MPDLISTLSANLTRIDQKTPQQLSDKTTQGAVRPSQTQQQKASLNVSILESAAVIIGVKDDPLSLVLSTAIDRLNEFLAPALGENAIQKIADSGLDTSPEATAERIVGLSTAFLGAFKAQHSGDDESAVLASFIETISNGIQTGFDEARDILDGLGVLEGEIASNIDQTFALVHEKLAAFEAMITDFASDPDEQFDPLS